MAFLTADDLALLTPTAPEVLAVMITDVEAQAVMAAPCLEHEDALSLAARAAVVGILRGAVLRGADYLGKDDRQMASGPFTIGPAKGGDERKPLLWPSELSALQKVCTGRGKGRAYVGWLA